jgi:hypothetical protein
MRGSSTKYTSTPLKINAREQYKIYINTTQDQCEVYCSLALVLSGVDVYFVLLPRIDLEWGWCILCTAPSHWSWVVLMYINNGERLTNIYLPLSKLDTELFPPLVITRWCTLIIWGTLKKTFIPHLWFTF